MKGTQPTGIILGAGRGQRLMPLTENTPKCYAEIGGRRILDWILEALYSAGIDQIIFVGGYQIERVRSDYPNLEFRENYAWETTNMLASLFCAEDIMNAPFVCSYADILYRPAIVRRLIESSHDITLAVDTHWATRYTTRTQHPPDDAEKVIAMKDRITRVSRTVPNDAAAGEFIGVAVFSKEGAAALRAAWHRTSTGELQLPDHPSSAYLIQLLDAMLRGGTPIHLLETAGEYMEVDTQEDYQLAQEHWQ